VDNYEIKVLNSKEYKKWDSLAYESPHGTIFHESKWIKLFGDFLNKKIKIYLIENKEEIIGGFNLYLSNKGIFNLASTVVNTTPYGGIILSEKEKSERKRLSDHRILSSYLDEVFYIENLSYAKIVNSPSLIDTRAFQSLGWKTSVLYTYYLDLDNFFPSRDVKRNISKAKEEGIRIECSKDINSFFEVYSQTYERQLLEIPLKKPWIKKIFNQYHDDGRANLYIAKSKNDDIIAGEIFLYDNKRAYRWIAGTNKDLRKSGGYTLLLFEVSKLLLDKGIKELNLMAGNTPQLTEFITAFNPKLVPYYCFEKEKRIYQLTRDSIKKFKIN